MKVDQAADQILNALQEVVGQNASGGQSASAGPVSHQALEVREVPIDDIFVSLPSDSLRPAVQVLIEQFDLRHLSTITGRDTGDKIELLYHFWSSRGLTLCTTLPREDAHIATLTDLIPGAAFYEREVSEMLHVTFDRHPDPQALLLPDDWNGEAPLRLESASTPGENDR